MCPDPDECPVITPDHAIVRSLPRALIAERTRWYRAYDGTWGYDEPNPGFGDSRFAPFDDAATSARVPTVYLADTITGALLETVFHEADHHNTPIVAEEMLRSTLLAHLETPAPLTLADFRDDVLTRFDLSRESLSASTPEHYPCTRRIARAVHDHGLDGLIWHSRQAELQHAAGHPVSPAEVIVVFCDRYGRQRGAWHRIGPGSQSLAVDSGRDLVDRLAEHLGITILTAE